LLAHGDVALTNDMLKDYKVGKAYEYFSSGWLQEGYFLKTTFVSRLSNGPELALHRHDREFKKNMHKFHTLQCKNNKLLLSNHHLPWYAVWPPNVLTDITQFLLAHGDVALTNDMLKDYKVGKACYYLMVLNWHCIDMIEN
jgi:hypothetical protein